MLQIYKASAGSGKTHILTQTFLLLAFKSPDSFKKILAVTFTNKAAQEMKERILETLDQLISQPENTDIAHILLKQNKSFDLNEIKNRALKIRANILHNYSFFSVGTIDSFVQKVIRAFSFEIGVQSGYRIEMDTQNVVEDITDLLIKEVENDAALLKWLVMYSFYKIEQGKSWDFREDVKKLAYEIFKENFNENTSLQNDKKSTRDKLTKLRKELFKITQTFDTEVVKAGEKAAKILKSKNIIPTDLGHKFRTIFNYFVKLQNSKDYTDFIPGKSIIAAQEGIEFWHKKKEKAEIISQIEQIYDELHALLQEIIAFVRKNLPQYATAKAILGNFHAFGILNDISSLLPTYRAENNLLLISDTTLLLKQLVAKNEAPFIYEKTGNRYAHILIDEFQDTSGFQWENFKPLLQNSLAENHFSMIVGDIKQSIYRWRGGDWKLLLSEVKRQIGEIYITEKALDTNWRSKKNVIDFNNAIFSFVPQLLQNDFNFMLEAIDNKEIKDALLEEGFDHILLEGYKDFYQNVAQKNKTGGAVELKFCEVKSRTSMKSKWREEIDEEIPEIIENLICTEGYNPKEIAILVRKNKDASQVINLLIRHMQNTPDAEQYSIISSESLSISSSFSVRIILNALDLLYDEENKIARSGLIHLYQTEIANQAPLHTHFSCSAEEIHNLQLLPDTFTKQTKRLRQLSIIELIEELISIFSLDKIEEETIYLRSFQDIVYQFLTENTSDLGDFLEWWNKKGNDFSVKISEGIDAVNIMSIHKSKGLGFKVVVIPYCDWAIESSGIIAPIIWAETKSYPGNIFQYLPVKYSQRLVDSEFAKNYFEEKLYMYMDSINALYVAFTRAKEKLIVCAPYVEKINKITSVSEILQLTILEQSIDSTNRKDIIRLADYFDEDEKTLHIVQEKEKNKAQTPKQSNDCAQIKLSGYFVSDWRKKIEIHQHAKDFFIESIKSIAEKVNYGLLMHKIFAKIKTIDDVDETILKIYLSGQINAFQRAELKKKVEEIISREAVADWFSDRWNIITERAILTKSGKIRIPDRVLSNDEETIVIDFKFGEERSEDREQVSEYVELISEMGFENVKGFLYYAEKNTVSALN